MLFASQTLKTLHLLLLKIAMIHIKQSERDLLVTFCVLMDWCGMLMCAISAHVCMVSDMHFTCLNLVPFVLCLGSEMTEL